MHMPRYNLSCYWETIKHLHPEDIPMVESIAAPQSFSFTSWQLQSTDPGVSFRTCKINISFQKNVSKSVYVERSACKYLVTIETVAYRSIALVLANARKTDQYGPGTSSQSGHGCKSTYLPITLLAKSQRAWGCLLLLFSFSVKWIWWYRLYIQIRPFLMFDKCLNLTVESRRAIKDEL